VPKGLAFGYTEAMNDAFSALARPRLVLLAIVLASLAVLTAAFTAQYLFGIEPCVLCLYQRVPYGATAVLAVGGVSFAGEGRMAGMIVGLCGVVFLTGAGLAFYHVGVEQHWWGSIAACGGGAPGDMTVEQLRAGLAAQPPKPCDQVDWTLFGVSLAGYNVLSSLSLAAFSLAGARILIGRGAP
jgi:disulfide bond formation protein DsbB